MSEISNSLRFDTGIDAITQHNPADDGKLPDTSKALPGESTYERKLDDVLYPPSIEQSLIDSMRPNVSEREVLSPIKYQSMLEHTQQRLTEDSLQLDSPEAQQQIQHTLQLLDEEKSLRDLLNTYRHVLHRG